MVRIGSSSLIFSTLLAVVSVGLGNGALAARMHRGVNQVVCGWRADGPQTYTSALAAQRDRAHVVHLGPCQPISCWSWMGVLRTEPMCGIDPLTKVRMTYPNKCAAEHAQAIWLRDGACRGRR